MKFEPDLFICYLFGILLVTPIFDLDMDLFFFNATFIMIGLGFVLLFSNFLPYKKDGKKTKLDTK